MTRQLILRQAADVRPQRPRWAWERRIPLGAVTLLAGREGLGKSTAAGELAARLTRGELEGDLEGLPANAIYASAEDSAESTLVPRLSAACADLSRMSLLEVVVGDGEAKSPDALTLPNDTNALRDAAKHADARLLVLDPLVSYLNGAINAHRDQHVRRVLAPLARLASDLDLAILAIVHLNKGDAMDVLARVGGSVGFTAAARSVLVFGRDPNDPEGEHGGDRLVAHAKCNLAAKARTLTARVEPRLIDGDDGVTIPTSRLVLLEETEQTARDVLTEPTTADERSAQDEAADFLRAELADGAVATKQLRATAEGAGISWRSCERVKKQVGARSRKVGGAWCWELKTATSLKPPLGGVGGVGGLEGKDAKTAKDTEVEGAAVLKLPLPDAPETRGDAA